MGKCILNLWYLRAVLSLRFETKNGKLERSADSTRWKQGRVLTNGNKGRLKWGPTKPGALCAHQEKCLQKTGLCCM